jgi:glycosyltransferase involved in cell wall biosynthesis
VAELISVIVTTFNREDALDAVLRSLAMQGDRNFEVIVADDGSGAATANLIDAWKLKFAHRLEHIWHADQGFRAAEIRNRAILAARGTYCIFLDGDCIVRPDFVATHRRLAELGWFVTGNRVLLSPALTLGMPAAGLASAHAAASTDCRPFSLCRSAFFGESARMLGRVRAPVTSPSGGSISIVSTDLMRTIGAGEKRTPTLLPGFFTPASAARTAFLPPA